jgi:hypothetical protein
MNEVEEVAGVEKIEGGEEVVEDLEKNEKEEWDFFVKE